MRTTLTIDDDVAALLLREVQTRKVSFEAALNDALRRGLAPAGPPSRRPRRFRTKTVNLGAPRQAIDDVWEVIAQAEGEAFR